VPIGLKLKANQVTTVASMESQNHFKVPAAEIEARILSIQRVLQQEDIDGLFIVQRVDLFYFSGTAQNGFMYIPAKGPPLLFIRQYLPRAERESSIADIIKIASIKEIPGLITDFFGAFPRVLGFELDVLPVNDFNFFRGLLPAKKWVDASAHILGLRRIKSAWEIAQLENTAAMTARTFEFMRTALRPGLTEMEFAGIFETYARRLGHASHLRVRHYQTEGYPWHVLSGKNGAMVGLLDSPASGEGTSAAFPVGAGHKKIRADEPVMVDLGSVLNGYHMDETRMFAFGSMPRRAMEASLAAVEIHNRVAEKAVPGVSVGELFDDALKIAKSLGYAKQYLGIPGHKVSFIGHGIGLELIEPYIIARNRRDSLEAGMVFALEPKMVFKNEFAAGIESVFVVTATGARLISRVPVEIFICQ
jgi:Xaa-Pro aminopeptidase